MGLPIQRLAITALLAVTGVASLPGCAAFKMGNPFLPAARIFVTPNPAVVSCDLTLNQATNQITFQRKNVQFALAPNQGDITPGVNFTDYTLAFQDQSGNNISTLLIPTQRLGVSIYVPPGGGSSGSGTSGSSGTTAPAGGGSTGGSGAISLPVVQDSVIQYGETYGFRNAGTTSNPRFVANNEPWSQNITGVITFYGQDQNQYPIQASGSFTIQYQINVQAASGSFGG